MNIVFCSLRGSPGVTTLATICAAQWADPCVLLEADLSGGVLGQRYGLSAGTPNLVSFAATARHEMTEEAIWSSCRQLPDGVAAVIAPERPEEVRRGLEQLSLSSAPDGPDLLIDGGRYSRDLSRLEAEIVVVVANPILEQLNLLISLAPDVVYGAQLGVVLAGRGPYQAGEVAISCARHAATGRWCWVRCQMIPKVRKRQSRKGRAPLSPEDRVCTGQRDRW